jgi:hypothetical protein
MLALTDQSLKSTHSHRPTSKSFSDELVRNKFLDSVLSVKSWMEEAFQETQPSRDREMSTIGVFFANKFFDWDPEARDR